MECVVFVFSALLLGGMSGQPGISHGIQLTFRQNVINFPASGGWVAISPKTLVLGSLAAVSYTHQTLPTILLV